MKTNNEDSAFGFSALLSRGEDVYNHGLTKRELFAAMAMQGLFSSGENRYGSSTNALAKYAVSIAELNKEEK